MENDLTILLRSTSINPTTWSKLPVRFLLLSALFFAPITAPFGFSNTTPVECSTKEVKFGQLLLTNIQLKSEVKSHYVVLLTATNFSSQTLQFGTDEAPDINIKFEESFDRHSLSPYKEEIIAALFDADLQILTRKTVRGIELVLDRTKPLAKKYVGQAYEARIFKKKKRKSTPSKRPIKKTKNNPLENEPTDAEIIIAEDSAPSQIKNNEESDSPELETDTELIAETTLPQVEQKTPRIKKRKKNKEDSLVENSVSAPIIEIKEESEAVSSPEIEVVEVTEEIEVTEAVEITEEIQDETVATIEVTETVEATEEVQDEIALTPSNDPLIEKEEVESKKAKKPFFKLPKRKKVVQEDPVPETEVAEAVETVEATEEVQDETVATIEVAEAVEITEETVATIEVAEIVEATEEVQDEIALTPSNAPLTEKEEVESKKIKKPFLKLPKRKKVVQEDPVPEIEVAEVVETTEKAQEEIVETTEVSEEVEATEEIQDEIVETIEVAEIVEATEEVQNEIALTPSNDPLTEKEEVESKKAKKPFFKLSKKKKVVQEEKEGVSFTSNIEEEEEPFYYNESSCADIIIDSIAVIKNKNNKWITVQYTITNQGTKSANIYGKAGNDRDNLAIKVFLASSENLTRGSIPIGGSFIKQGIDDGILLPNQSHTGVFKIDIRKKTSFTPFLIFSADHFNVMIECDKTNNKNHIFVQ